MSDLEGMAAQLARLEEWAKELETSGTMTGGVGPFIAAELRRRLQTRKPRQKVQRKGHNLEDLDPLADAEAIFRDDYYIARSDEVAETQGSKPTGEAPHYKVICISMYNRDIEELEAKVVELKRRGWTKANKSHLIRMALDQLDLEKVPTPWK